MNPLFKKLVLLLAALLISILILLYLPGNYNFNLAAIINKTNLLKSSGSPKMVFLGGSGLYTGLNSERIEKELGLPVVNMGLWGGFHYQLQYKIIAPHINKGDKIILLLEYGYYTTPVETYLTEEARPWIFGISKSQYLKEGLPFSLVRKDVFTVLQYKLQGFIRNILNLKFYHLFENGAINYTRTHNKQGDPTFEHFVDLPSDRIEGLDSNLTFKNQKDFIKQTNRFYETVKSKGAELFLVLPAYPLQEYRVNTQAMDDLYLDLKSNLNFKMIGDHKKYLFDISLFSNTVNHLNNQGKEDRTSQLIADLKNEFYPPE